MAIPNGNHEGPVHPLEMAVRRNSLVNLPCQTKSNLAHKSWTHNGREVPPSELNSQPVGLGFVATPSRQGRWECWATENQFRTLLVSYSLKVDGGFMDAPATEKESSVLLAANGDQRLHVGAAKTYWSELVLVSVFFALFVAVVAVMTLYHCSGRLRSKGKVQEGGPPRAENAAASGSCLEAVPLNKAPVSNGSCRSLQDEEARASPASREQEGPAEVKTGPAPPASSGPLKGPPQPHAQTQVDI